MSAAPRAPGTLHTRQEGQLQQIEAADARKMRLCTSSDVWAEELRATTAGCSCGTAAPGAGALQIDDLERRIAYRQRRDVGASSSHSECGRIINSQRVCSHPLYPLSSRGDCSRSTGEALPSSAAVDVHTLSLALSCAWSSLRARALRVAHRRATISHGAHFHVAPTAQYSMPARPTCRGHSLTDPAQRVVTPRTGAGRIRTQPTPHYEYTSIPPQLTGGWALPRYCNTDVKSRFRFSDFPLLSADRAPMGNMLKQTSSPM